MRQIATAIKTAHQLLNSILWSDTKYAQDTGKSDMRGRNGERKYFNFFFVVIFPLMEFLSAEDLERWPKSFNTLCIKTKLLDHRIIE